MSATRDEMLFGSMRRKRILNQLYVDMIVVAHALLGLLPGPLRNLAWRVLLRSCGPGTFFDHRVYVKFPRLVDIGADVSVNRGVEFYPDLRSRSGITLGDGVYIGPRARFHASGHDTSDLTQHIGAPIVVEDGCWIGSGAVILPGVTIGEGAVVAAQAVVSRDVEPRTIVGGVPARVISERDAD